jgi:two-component system NtrC family response regulator
MSDEAQRIKLLVVDDEVNFLKAISKKLTMRDFDVTTATDGKTAIKAAKGDKFDVAILDLKMPGMDGTELLGILKKRHKFLEVVMLTGYPSLDSAVETTKLGAYHYLDKSAGTDKLVEVLKEAYEKRLRNKFKNDKDRLKEIDILAMGSSPIAILNALRRLEDGEK